MPSSAWDLSTIYSGLAAFSSVIAAGAAIAVPWRINTDAVKRAEQERTTEAQCLATAILLQCTAVGMNIAAARRAGVALHKSLSEKLFGVMRETFLSDFSVRPPPVLEASTDRLWILGPQLGPELLGLLSATVVYNRGVESILATLHPYPTPTGEVVFVHPPEVAQVRYLEGGLDILAKQLQHVQAELQKISGLAVSHTQITQELGTQ